MATGKSDATNHWVAIAVALIGAAATIIAAFIGVSNSRQKTESALVVTDVSLNTADGGRYDYYNLMKCPVTIKLAGNIAVTAPGTVSYRFVRIHGLNQPEEQGRVMTATFDAAGSTQVFDEVNINIPEGEFYTGEILEIVHPVNKRSNQVDIMIFCGTGLPDGPPGPPPNVENTP
jgi:hypothetical protein